MAKKQVYTFVERKHSKNGVLSTVLGGISLLIFVALAVVSFLMRGGAGPYVGAIGLSAMVISFAGLILGLRSFNEQDKIYFYSKVGSVVSGLVTVGWFAVFLFGI